MALYFNGEAFGSLSEAATKLGLSQPHLSALKRTLHLSDEEALEHAMARRDTTGLRGNKKGCTVFGIQYSSIAEACREYEIPYVSLRSRMSRHSETIEEAIAALLKSKANIPAAEGSLFSKSSLREVQTPVEPQKDSLKGLAKQLSVRGYLPVFFDGEDAGSCTIQIQKALSGEREGQCWIIIGRTQTKLVATDFFLPVESIDKHEALDMLNTRNASNTGITLWLRKEANMSTLDITAGISISNSGNYEPPVLSLLKEIEHIYKFCQSAAKDFGRK